MHLRFQHRYAPDAITQKRRECARSASRARRSRAPGTAPLTDDERAVLRQHRRDAQGLPELSRDTLRRAIDGKALRPNTREACKRAIEQLTKPG